MKKLQWKSPKGIAIIAAAAAVVALAVVLTIVLTQGTGINIVKVPAEDEYVYYNPDETKAETDADMKVDGVLDEDVYANKNWLYLSNNDAGNQVDIAMTSHFGEKGMYIVFDVTETSPIYVNPSRSPVLNTCIELYLVPPYLSKLTANSMFEIDLLPTGDIAFRKTNGKYGYIDVTSTYDKMAYLGATTKGGEVNTLECYGYTLELYIPWAYLEWLEIDVQAIKDSYMLINPAHITSHNLTGTDNNIDRSWYHYVQQLGADFNSVSQYFRFDGNGVIGTKEITLQEGEHYSFKGNNIALPGMQVPITIVPDEGYALTSVLVDGQEQITKTAFNEDGSVTVMVRCTNDEQKVSATAEAVTPGKKTLSGKVYLNGMKDLLVSYIGPQGEKPVTYDADGNFVITDLEPGYYELKVEKQGLGSSTHGIYLNRDMYTELVLRVPLFTVTGGSSWILDNANMGILEKLSGAGHVISNASYNDFTLETYIKYDPELAKLSNDDMYWQQRSGVRIMFSNGKYWHINLLHENDRYLLQYAKHTGDNSMYSWKNVHTLTEEQIAMYSSAEGIKLTIKRVGNKAAIYLGDKVLLVEELAEEYKNCTAQVGFEAWIANSEIMQVPYILTDSAVLPNAPKIYFYASNTWNVEEQEKGVVYKTGVKDDITWLDAAIVGNDITTISKDLDPDANDYSMVYIFKFSNGEQFRVRLNGTDTDNKYRIQSFAGSTLFDPWKNHYTLTDEQAQKVVGEGIAFRVWISGTTAYVYLDGQEVCTYDLSKVVATGQPSGIEKATVTVSLRIDGIIGQTVAIPFELKQTDTPVEPEKPVEPETPIDPEKKINLTIANIANGTITPNKKAYAIGDTVILKVEPSAGYAQKLYINGKPLMLDGTGNTYTFVAEEKNYEITGEFVPQINWFWTADFGVNNHAHGFVYAPAHSNGEERTGDLVPEKGVYDGLSVLVQDASKGVQKDYAIVLKMHFTNGQKAEVRLIDRDDNGKYCLQVIGSNLAGNWATLHWLTDAENEAVLNGNGVWYGIHINGTKLQLKINDNVVYELELSTHGINGFGDVDQIKVAAYNFGYAVQIPYRLYKNGDTEIEPPVEEPPVEEPPVVEPPVDNAIQLTIPTLANGTVKSNKTAYAVGDTVTLTVTPDSGYAQKLYINGAPLLLDGTGMTYTFVATEDSYEITGEFVPKTNWFWTADFGVNNAAHGVVHAPANSGKEATGELVPERGVYKGMSVLVKDVSHGARKDYAIVLKMTFTNGQKAEVRLIDRDDNGKYCLQVLGNNILGNWATLHWLTDAENQAVVNGEGVWYGICLDGTKLQLKINDTVVFEKDLSANGISGVSNIDQIKLQAYNFTYAVDIAYRLDAI